MMTGIQNFWQHVAEIDARRQSGKMIREDYLFLLKFLPVLRLRELGFIPTTKDEKEEAYRLSWMYATLAEWLDFLTAGDKEANPELILTEKSRLKPRALLSKAIFDLAAELLSRIPNLKTSSRRTPLDILLAIETQNFDDWVMDSGLLTGRAVGTFREPKNKLEHRFQSFAKSLACADGRQLQRATPYLLDSKTQNQELDDFQTLAGFAWIEASSNTKFRYSPAYAGFQQALKKLASVARRDKSWQMLSFENGQLLPTGRNADRKTSKGFVTKSLR